MSAGQANVVAHAPAIAAMTSATITRPCAQCADRR
jgi:hypothetical protein